MHNYAGAHGVGGVDPSLDDRKISNVISTLDDIADVVIPCDREFALVNELGRDDIGTQLQEWMHRYFPDPKRDLPPYHAGNYAETLHRLWGGNRGITDPRILEVWKQLRAVVDSAAPAAGDEVITPEAVRDSDRARALTGGNPSRVLPATTDHSPAKKLGVLSVLSGHGGI